MTPTDRVQADLVLRYLVDDSVTAGGQLHDAPAARVRQRRARA